MGGFMFLAGFVDKEWSIFALLLLC